MTPDLVDFYAQRAWNDRDEDFDFGFSRAELSKLIQLVRDDTMQYTTPECWIVLKISTPNEMIHKVLAGWSGNLFNPDQWRLNSGIDVVKEEDDAYIVHGFSGNTYRCLKNKEYTNWVMQDVLEDLLKEIGRAHV